MSLVDIARRARAFCCAVLAVMAAGLPAAGHAASTDEGRVIVKFKSTVSSSQGTGPQAQALSEHAALAAAAARIGSVGRRTGLALRQGRMLSVRMHVIKAAGLTSKALAAQLSHDPDVEYAVVDARRTIQTVTIPPNDPLYPDNLSGAVAPNGPVAGQWYLRAPDTSTASGIDAEPAWALTTGSASGPIVAVIDTGVRYDHPDLPTGLGGKLLPGASMLSAQSVYNDDATDPGDSVVANECSAGSPAENSSWHGTQVAGLIGALSNNTTGMASVGWDVRVLPVRVLAQCGGYDSDIIAAMNWVVGGTVSGVTTLAPGISSQVKVINLSLGSDGACTQAYIDAINNVRSHGVVVVAAAGNTDGQAVSAPANCPGVIAVGGLRHTGTKVGYSAVGPEISLSAPGGNCGLGGTCLYPILTTTNAGTTTATTSTYSDSINISAGTSFATPLVSGTAALMMTARPALLPDDVRRLLRDNVHAFLPAPGGGVPPVCHAPDGTVQSECVCTTTTCGAGMLDAGLAVAAAASGVVPRITVSPASPQPGQVVTFDASGSLPSTGGTAVTTYAWSVKDGGGIVSAISGPANTAQVSVTPSASGTFTLQLVVTDDAATPASATTTQTVTVTAPPQVAQTSGGGGGGAASALSLALLALAVGAVARQRRA